MCRGTERQSSTRRIVAVAGSAPMTLKTGPTLPSTNVIAFKDVSLSKERTRPRRCSILSAHRQTMPNRVGRRSPEALGG